MTFESVAGNLQGSLTFDFFPLLFLKPKIFGPKNFFNFFHCLGFPNAAVFDHLLLFKFENANHHVEPNAKHQVAIDKCR